MSITDRDIYHFMAYALESAGNTKGMIDAAVTARTTDELFDFTISGNPALPRILELYYASLYRAQIALVHKLTTTAVGSRDTPDERAQIDVLSSLLQEAEQIYDRKKQNTTIESRSGLVDLVDKVLMHEIEGSKAVLDLFTAARNKSDTSAIGSPDLVILYQAWAYHQQLGIALEIVQMIFGHNPTQGETNLIERIRQLSEDAKQIYERISQNIKTRSTHPVLTYLIERTLNGR